MATQLNCKVVTPPGYVSGTWELAPFAPYSVGTGASALTITEPFRGDIDATGLLVVKGGTTPAQITVPASGGADAGIGVLTTNFKTATSTLPGRPMTLSLVETTAGVMDVAYLLSVGRAQVLTPQQAADLQALIASTTAAKAATLAATAQVTQSLAANAQAQAINNTQQQFNNRHGAVTDRGTYATVLLTPNYVNGWGNSTLTLTGRGWPVPARSGPINRITVRGRLYRVPNSPALRTVHWEVRAAAVDGVLVTTGQTDVVLSGDWADIPLTSSVDLSGDLYVLLWCDGVYLELINSEPNTTGPQTTVRIVGSADPLAWQSTGTAGVFARYEYAALLSAVVLTSEVSGLVAGRVAFGAPNALTQTAPAAVLLGAVVNSKSVPHYTVEPSYIGAPILGWAWDAGALPDQTRYIEVTARALSTPATLATLRMLQGAVDGPVLAATALEVALTTDWAHIRFDLGAPMAAQTLVWLDVSFDALIQFEQCSASIPANVQANARVRLNSAPDQLLDVGAKFVQNARFYGAAAYDLRRTVSPAAQAFDLYRYGIPEFVIPTQFYAVEGHELSIYPRQAFLMTTDAYRECIVIAYGEGTPGSAYGTDRWRWTPTSADVGQARSMVIQIHKPDGTFIDSRRFNITVVAANAGAGVTRKLLLIADSHGRRGNWPAELQKLMNDSGGMVLTQIGTKATEFDPTIVNDAYPGWNVQDFVKQLALYNVDYNAFGVTGVFSIPDYMQRFNKSLGANDWLYIAHGTNSNDRPVAGSTDTALYESYLLKDMDAYEEIIASAHEYNPQVRIAISTMIPNAVVPGEDQFRLIHNHARYNRRLLRQFAGREAQGIYLFNHAYSLDRVYGYPRVLLQRGPRIPEVSVYEYLDTVHPQPEGYMQVADADFPFFKAML